METTFLSDIQKTNIEQIFLNTFKSPQKTHMSPDAVLTPLFNQLPIEVNNYLKMVKLSTNMGRFYENLFCYLCDFQKPKKDFDLIDTKENIYIELKSKYSTDNHNSKDSKFHHLGKFQTQNPNFEVIYMCLNDNRCLKTRNVNYKHIYGHRIITGTKAWEYLLKRANNLNKQDLIKFIQHLIMKHIFIT